MNRSPYVLGAAAVMFALIGGVVAMSGGNEATSATQDSPANTSKAKKGDLSTLVSLDGTLTYRARADGSPYSAINQASGTYTELPDEGDKVDCGDVLYRVDDDPIVLLCGAVPAYRDLNVGDEGNDVRQLNRNLHKLGYDADAGVEINPGDSDFTWKTGQALKKLQDGRDFDATGALEIDDAVFLPKAARISKVSGKLGGSAQPGGQVAQATSDTLEVQVDLEASRQGEIEKGGRAQITLPGNRSTTGKVRRIGKVAQTAANDDDVGNATIPAFISLDDPAKARGLDRAPARVEITTEGVENALSVPITAIVGRSGGGFAVEVVRAGGRRDLVAVELGLFDTAGGRVEVDGDLREGDRVVVPSL